MHFAMFFSKVYNKRFPLTVLLSNAADNLVSEIVSLVKNQPQSEQVKSIKNAN